MRRLVVLPLLALLPLAGCGSDDEAPEASGTPSESSSSSTSAPVETPNADLPGPEGDVKAYSDAFLTGNADAAFALLSTRCRETLGSTAFGSAVEQAGSLYGTPLEMESYSETVTEDGTASVTYIYAIAGINQTDEPWVYEDGWKNDDC